jgi:hypothetical protein
MDNIIPDSTVYCLIFRMLDPNLDVWELGVMFYLDLDLPESSSSLVAFAQFGTREDTDDKQTNKQTN